VREHDDLQQVSFYLDTSGKPCSWWPAACVTIIALIP